MPCNRWLLNFKGRLVDPASVRRVYSRHNDPGGTTVHGAFRNYIPAPYGARALTGRSRGRAGRLPSVHFQVGDRELFAIMSSDEFKKQKKGQSAQGRLTFGRQGIATSPYRLFTLYLHSDHNLNNRYRLANSRIFHNSSDNAAHTDFLSEYPSQNHLSASI